MSHSKVNKNWVKLIDDDNNYNIINSNIIVSDEYIKPKIIIYDQNNIDYWFRRIGFNRTITDNFG